MGSRGVRHWRLRRLSVCVCVDRDKVQSRGILLFSLLISLLFVTLVTISDTSFLFPKSFLPHGAAA